jgi:hypothetical protein
LEDTWYCPYTSWQTGGGIEQQLQKEMARNNKRENASRINDDYKVGDNVLLKKPGKHIITLEAPITGPHTVTTIYEWNLAYPKR